MALGFGFNKAKVLASAEKYVQQGKLQNAIGEYEKVARQDPKDLTVLNTIGDLYARLGQVDKATASFRRVGDHYAADGFTVKAIAMYKKLTKLNPGAIDAVQRLAEFYTQQGLYNDARQQYVSVAEHWLKSNDQAAAAAIFHKMLELDPDNTAVQTKLADLYIKLGKREDAREIFFRAADSLYMRGALDGADDALAKILHLDPTNARALMKRAQMAIDQGDGAAAAQFLEQVSDLDANADGLALLLRSHLKMGDAAGAEKAARTLAQTHHDFSGLAVVTEWLFQNGASDKALALAREFSSRLGADTLIRILEPVLTRERENPAALEKLLSIYTEIGSKAHILECTDLLANALAASGNLERARDLFAELARLEPDNPVHEQRYRQMLTKLGQDATVRPLSQAEAVKPFVGVELELTAPEVKQVYPPEVEDAIKAALTESELLSSYLPDKQLAPLEKVLSMAPRDSRLNARLVSLYASAQRYGDAARACDVLAELHAEQGNAEQANQYEELGQKYAQSASGRTGDAAQEDISSEWETAFEAPATAGAVAPVRETRAAGGDSRTKVQELIGEIKFYIAQGMWTEAASEVARCEKLDPNHPELAALKAQVGAAQQSATGEFAVEVEPPESAPRSQDFSFEVTPPAPAAPVEAVASTPVAPSGQFDNFLSDLDSSLPKDFQAPPPQAKAAAASAAPPAAPPVPPPPARAAAPPPVAKTDEEILLDDMFQEFKEEAEQGSTEVEDPETHYNLGVAFREMGLMDEAIGELQKVCNAIDKGVPFRDSLQAFTWLAQCFVDKGVPEASYKWYERALRLAGEEEQRMALHYDLASAYELAGNKPSALKHFMEVYGSNIDYRDVAERIKALRA